MKYSVHLVNLARGEDRLERMSALLSERALKFRRFEAVDGSVEDFGAVYDESAQIKAGYRYLTKAELGCYLSHFRLWERVAALEDEFYVILEDDVDVDASVPEVLAAINRLQFDWDVIRLAGLGVVPYLIAGKLDPHHDLVTLMRGSTGTQGYCISSKGARKLIEKALPISTPVDVYLDHDWISGIKTLAVMPYPIRANLSLESTIEFDRLARSIQFKEESKRFGFMYKVSRWVRKRKIAFRKTVRYLFLCMYGIFLRSILFKLR